MKRHCAWCHTDMGEDDGATTHGICDRCAEIHFKVPRATAHVGRRPSVAELAVVPDLPVVGREVAR